jgi:hypothetical protein
MATAGAQTKATWLENLAEEKKERRGYGKKRRKEERKKGRKEERKKGRCVKMMPCRPPALCRIVRIVAVV